MVSSATTLSLKITVHSNINKAKTIRIVHEKNNEKMENFFYKLCHEMKPAKTYKKSCRQKKKKRKTFGQLLNIHPKTDVTEVI
jgi:hypothetical protein